jgi:DNA-binding PadR family transcriptional regulator
VVLKEQPMTAYGVNNYFKEQLGISVSPGTIYCSIVFLERKGWIRCVKKTAGRQYALTELGNDIFAEMDSISIECRFVMNKLLKVHV